MTTIVYDHKNKKIAVDSRETSGGDIKSDSVIKWEYQGPNLYFIAGATADIAAFINAKKERGEKITPEIECSAIKVVDGKAYKVSFCEDSGYWEVPLTFSDGMGSGSNFALSALDFGLSAKEAVEYAKTKDIYTGGKVHVYDINKSVFLDG